MGHELVGVTARVYLRHRMVWTFELVDWLGLTYRGCSSGRISTASVLRPYVRNRGVYDVQFDGNNINSRVVTSFDLPREG